VSNTKAMVVMVILSALVVLAGCRAGRAPAAKTEWSVGEFKAEQPKKVSPRHTCARAPRAIVVDGDLSEWKGIAEIVLDRPEQAHGTWKNAADMSGSARLCYDSDYLYLAFVTTDDVFRHTWPLIPIWAGDCVQVAFDPLEDRRVGTRAPDDQEMTVALTPEGPRLSRWAGPQGRGPITTAKLGLVRRKTGGGVIYEIGIPWDELAPLAPKLRPSFGFTFSLNDYDERPEESWLQWTPGIQNGKNPSAFGQMVLEYTPPPAGETELYVTSTVPEKPNVTELTFPLFRHAVSDEKLAVTMTLTADEKTVAERKTEIAVEPGAHALALVWRPGGIRDGTYAGTVAVGDASGKTVTRAFNYERMITAPLAMRIDTLKQRIARLAKRRVELYGRHEATLAYRMDVAKQWIAGGGTVRAIVNGKLRLVDVEIDPELLADSQLDAGLLEDLIRAAVSAAQKKAADAAARAMEELTGGLSIPGIEGLM